MDTMKPVVAFDKVIPDRFGRPCGFQDDVHKVGIGGILRKSVPNVLVADNGIGCAGHMDKMRKMDIVSIDVI